MIYILEIIKFNKNKAEKYYEKYKKNRRKFG